MSLNIHDDDIPPVTDLWDEGLQEKDSILYKAYLIMECHVWWRRIRAAAILNGTPLPSYKELLDEIALLTGERETGLEVRGKTDTDTGQYTAKYMEWDYME